MVAPFMPAAAFEPALQTSFTLGSSHHPKLHKIAAFLQPKIGPNYVHFFPQQWLSLRLTITTARLIPKQQK
jgi:hypothetical protein